MKHGNLFEDLPQALTEEQFRDLAKAQGVRIERIVSTGQSMPSDEWMEQGWTEWVIVLRGAARLRFEGELGDRTLAPGDWIEIPPGQRHRVTWTTPDGPTVWLAVHHNH
jgi:cupin 2 domain-containing protein